MQEQVNVIQEDEIDLRELFKTIKRHIKKIIAFVFVVCILTLVYLVITPNMYKSEVILSPQGESSKIGGGLSSLAALAGVNLASKSSGVDPFTMMKTTLSDYEFNKYMIEKYNLYEKIKNPQNLVYPFGLEFSSDSDEDEKDISKEEKIYKAIKWLKDTITISQDQKTNLISLKVMLEDRFFAKELVDIYLKEIILHVKKSDMKEIDEQIKFYKTELNSVKDVALKEQLSKSLSGLLQKRVFSKSNEYYFVSKLSDSRASYIKEKIKPKRALILVVSLIASFILAVFLVFFLEFIRNEKE
ncbi:MAG: hypothetical protein KGV58_00955 [Campylobacteraceae bacterium]|nr:hypothetical protein [Campylobacteraceae bacterium]